MTSTKKVSWVSKQECTLAHKKEIIKRMRKLIKTLHRTETRATGTNGQSQL